MCDLDDVDLPDEDEDGETDYHETVVQVGGPTKCKQCRRRMAPGSMMNQISGTWSGEPGLWYECEVCTYMLKQPESSPFHMCPYEFQDGYKVPEWIEVASALHDQREPQLPILQEHLFPGAYGSLRHEDPSAEASNIRLSAALDRAWNLGRYLGK